MKRILHDYGNLSKGYPGRVLAIPTIRATQKAKWV